MPPMPLPEDGRDRLAPLAFDVRIRTVDQPPLAQRRLLKADAPFLLPSDTQLAYIRGIARAAPYADPDGNDITVHLGDVLRVAEGLESSQQPSAAAADEHELVLQTTVYMVRSTDAFAWARSLTPGRLKGFLELEEMAGLVDVVHVGNFRGQDHVLVSARNVAVLGLAAAVMFWALGRLLDCAMETSSTRSRNTPSFAERRLRSGAASRHLDALLLLIYAADLGTSAAFVFCDLRSHPDFARLYLGAACALGVYLCINAVAVAAVAWGIRGTLFRRLNAAKAVVRCGVVCGALVLGVNVLNQLSWRASAMGVRFSRRQRRLLSAYGFLAALARDAPQMAVVLMAASAIRAWSFLSFASMATCVVALTGTALSVAGQLIQLSRTTQAVAPFRAKPRRVWNDDPDNSSKTVPSHLMADASTTAAIITDPSSRPNKNTKHTAVGIDDIDFNLAGF